MEVGASLALSWLEEAHHVHQSLTAELPNKFAGWYAPLTGSARVGGNTSTTSCSMANLMLRPCSRLRRTLWASTISAISARWMRSTSATSGAGCSTLGKAPSHDANE